MAKSVAAGKQALEQHLRATSWPNRHKETGSGSGLLNFKLHPHWHTSSNKATLALLLILSKSSTSVLCFLLLQWNTMTRKQVKEGRVYSVYTSISLFSIKRNQHRNSNRAGTWRNCWCRRYVGGAAYWLALRGLVNMLSYRTRATCQKWHHPQWAKPSSINH